MFSHAFALTGGTAIEPIAWASGRLADGGALAVAAFFAISGFLVTRSAEQRPPAAYLRARALRIWPAAIVAVLVQTLVIGLAFTALPWRAYLGHPATWRSLLTATIVVLRPDVPGVFTHNPLPGEMNGSLWTLRVELACYAIPLALAATRLLRPFAVLPLAAGAFALFAAAAAARAHHAASPLADPRIVSALTSLWDFLLGAALYTVRRRVPFGPGPALLAAGLCASARAIPLGVVLLHLAWPYLVLSAGLARPVGHRVMRRLGDISYGMYLYAFPTQQAVIAALGPEWGPLPLAAFALPPVLGLACLSSRLVEMPALRLKRRSAAVTVHGQPRRAMDTVQ